MGLSWAVLDPSWGHLGGSLEPLGASWGGLLRLCCGSFVFVWFRIGFGINFEIQKGRQKVPKSTPKRSEIDYKIQLKNNTLLGPSWHGLGLFLGHFGVDFEVKNHWFLLCFKGFREKPHFSIR